MQNNEIVDIKVISAGSPPDIDSDVSTVYRENLVQHLAEVYGQGNVANIGVYGTYKAKKAFKDMCTIYSIPFSEANSVSATIPFSTEANLLKSFFDSGNDLYGDGEDFRKAVSGKKWKPIVDGALRMEGRVSSVGTHACGIIVSGRPLNESVPLQYVKKDGESKRSTQWEYPYLEALGMLKMDVLGLDTVSLIQSTVENCLRAGVDSELVNMDRFVENGLVDKKTYELFQRGETFGVFQFSNPKVQELCRHVKPENLDEIADITALYRPGPMDADAHNDYWKIKHGHKSFIPVDEAFVGTRVEDILRPTRCLIVYQESIMSIARECAGFSAEEADVLRKAIGKKKMDLLASLREKFVSGMVDCGYSVGAVEKLWNTIVAFGQYAFNKSHSISYAILAVCSAYLKANFPREFMAAAINQKALKGKVDEVGLLIQEANRMGIVVEPVNVNKSSVDISPDFVGGTNSIYLGLSTIKGMNMGVANRIVQVRKQGLFSSVEDFIVRTNINVEDHAVKLNKRMFDCLAYAGGFDCLNVARKSCIDGFESFITYKTKQVKVANRFSGNSLFEMDDLDDGVSSNVCFFDNINEFSFLEKAYHEANITGMFASVHPMSNVPVRKDTISSVVEYANSENKTFWKTFYVRCCVGAVDKIAKNGVVKYQITLNDLTGFVDTVSSYVFNKSVACLKDTQSLIDCWVDGVVGVDKSIIRSALSVFDDNSKLFYQQEPVLANVYDTVIVVDSDGNVKVEAMTPVVLDNNGKVCQSLVFSTYKKGSRVDYVDKYVQAFSDNRKLTPDEYYRSFSVTTINDLLDLYIPKSVIECVCKDVQDKFANVGGREFTWQYFSKRLDTSFSIDIDKVKKNILFPLYEHNASVSEYGFDVRKNILSKRMELPQKQQDYFNKVFFLGDDVTFGSPDIVSVMKR